VKNLIVIAGKLRITGITRGETIGPDDLLIATHALAMELVLVTANESEFSRVPDLKVENWLRT
jgi:tRNA(fMet)-specific endonuclease VapC